MVRMSPIETLHLVLGNLITSKRLRKPFPFDLGALGCFSMRFASTGEPKISCFSFRASLPGNVVGCIIEDRVVEGVGDTVGRLVGPCVGITLGIISVLPPGVVIIISVAGGGAGESGGGSSDVVRIGIVGSGPSGSVGAGSVGAGIVGISVDISGGISGGIGVIGGSSCWANFCSCTPG